MSDSLPPPPNTSRELLEHAAGPRHAYHSAVRRKLLGRRIALTCSCGEVIDVPRNSRTEQALRNVPVR